MAVNPDKLLNFLCTQPDTNMYEYAFSMVHSCCLNTYSDFPKQHWTSREKKVKSHKMQLWEGQWAPHRLFIIFVRQMVILSTIS